jgi:hypothetical protein
LTSNKIGSIPGESQSQSFDYIFTENGSYDFVFTDETNTHEETVTAFVDWIQGLAIYNNSNEYINLSNESSYAFSGSCVGVDAVTVEIDDDNDELTSPNVSEIVNCSGEEWTLTGSGSSFESLNDGAIYISVGQDTDTDELQITKDTVVPTINISSPSNNSATNSRIVNIVGSSEVYTDISVTGELGSVAVNTNDNSSFGFDLLLTSDSENTIALDAQDRAGNSSSSSTLTITHQTADSQVEDLQILEMIHLRFQISRIVSSRRI